MKTFDLYLSRAMFSCFEGEGEAGVGAGDGSGAGEAGAAGAGANAGEAGRTSFTQDDVNRLLAEDRRKHQAQLKQMETRLQDVLKSQTLTESERKALQENLTAIQGQLRSKEQQAALEKQELEQSYQGKLSDLEKKASVWENLYRDSTIDRALLDAAMKNDAFSPSQIITQLRNQTKLIEDTDAVTGKPNGRYKVVVEMMDVDPKTGQQVNMTRTAEEAVKRMKEMPEQYGNLFKSGVVSGIGSGSATGGLLPGQSGRIDVRKLTPQQYREIREKNPELLGLRPRGRR